MSSCSFPQPGHDHHYNEKYPFLVQPIPREDTEERKPSDEINADRMVEALQFYGVRTREKTRQLLWSRYYKK